MRTHSETLVSTGVKSSFSVPFPKGGQGGFCSLSQSMLVTKDTCDQLLHARTGPSDSNAVGEAPLKLEKVDEVLWGHGQEAAVGVGGCARVSRVLREEGQGYTDGHQLFGKWPPDPISKGHGR